MRKPEVKPSAAALVEKNVAATHDDNVEARLNVLRVDRDAKERLAAEDAGSPATFDVATLEDVLNRPSTPFYRVDDLILATGNTLVVAQAKTGKSTLMLNLARALLTGARFLDTFDVVKVSGTVAFLNFEVTDSALARWAREVGVPGDRLVLANLQGGANPFRRHNDMAALARDLKARNVETVIVDTFGRAYTDESQNDSGQVMRFLVKLDQWVHDDVDAADLILTAHAGWKGERTRGSSALDDWPDSIITMTKNDQGVRFLRAEGRDVLVEEDRLDFDPRTRLLTMTNTGSRKTVAKAAKADGLVPHVIEVVKAHSGITGQQLHTKLREAKVPHQKGDEIKAAALAVRRGDLLMSSGNRGAKHYTVADAPHVPRRPPMG